LDVKNRLKKNNDLITKAIKTIAVGYFNQQIN